MSYISRRLALCSARSTAASAIALFALIGCTSEYHRQVEQAKVTAVNTGQAQQVVSIDRNGTTTVTVVQPGTTPGAQPTVSTVVTPSGARGGAFDDAGQPDWTNGARPAPGNTVTFAGPKIARVAAASSVPVLPVTRGGPAPPLETSAPTDSVALPDFAPMDGMIPAGTGLAIRLNQTISVKHSHAGDRFTGELAEGVTEHGKPVLPRGTRVNGIVTESHHRGRFKGRSALGLRLTSVVYQGKVYPLATGSLHRAKQGRGKRSEALIGTGTAVGMLAGGLATGGVGLAVGGLAGGGLGTSLDSVTDNRDLDLPAESLVRFKLQDNLTVEPAE